MSLPTVSNRGSRRLSAQAACSRMNPRLLDVGLLIEDLRQGMGRGDGGELVIAVKGRGEYSHGARSTVTTGLEREIIGESHRVDEPVCSQHCV
jgi:hypothetical protein